MMIHVQKRSLIQFLPQHEHESFGELEDSQQQEQIEPKKNFDSPFPPNEVKAFALPDEPIVEAKVVGHHHENTARHDLKDVVEAKPILDGVRIPVLHELREIAEDNPEVKCNEGEDNCREGYHER
jgi:hypothetical protein